MNTTCLYVDHCNSQGCRHHEISSLFIILPLTIIGIITNFLNICVWKTLMSRAKRRNVTCGIYLISIAITDIGMLTSFFMIDTLRFLVDDVFHNPLFNNFYAYVAYPLFVFFLFLSIWLIAGVNACRLILVLYPFKMRQSASHMTVIAILAISAFCFLVNVPSFFSFTTKWIDGENCLIRTGESLKKSFIGYRFWFQCIFLNFFPWFIIVLVSLFLVARYIQNSRRPTFPQRGQEMGKVLLAVSFWFIFTLLWQCITQCVFLKTSTNSHNFDTVNSSMAFGKMGVILNSSLKIFIYLGISSSFRKTFMYVLSSPKKAYKNNRSIIFQSRYTRKSINAIAPIGPLNAYLTESKMDSKSFDSWDKKESHKTNSTFWTSTNHIKYEIFRWHQTP